MSDQASMKIYGNTKLIEVTPKRPLVTFALFAYNNEKYIYEAVKGAISQTYEPLEIILSDDCSSDRTFEIMQETAANYRGPHKVKVERTASNLGRERFGLRVWSLLKQSSGELIILAAGDDISSDKRAERLFTVWDRANRPPSCIHSLVRTIDANGNQTGKPLGDNGIANKPLEEFIRADGRGLLGAATAVSKSLITSFGAPPDSILFEDGILAFRARLIGQILMDPEVLVNYRIHPESMTAPRLFTNPEYLEQHVSKLIEQHICYLTDYNQHCRRPQLAVNRAIAKRLTQVAQIRRIVGGGPLARFNSTLSLYSHIDFIARMKIALHCAFKPPFIKERLNRIPQSGLN